MNLIALRFGDLVDEALASFYSTNERPRVVSVGSVGLDSISDTTLTLIDPGLSVPSVGISDLLQVGDELMLVIGMSDDADPVYTVYRGYLNTTPTTAPTGTLIEVGPFAWPRHEVKRWVIRFFRTIAAKAFPNVITEVFNREPGLRLVEMPANTMTVSRVQYSTLLDGTLTDVGGWEWVPTLPTATGSQLRLPSVVADSDDLLITYQVPWTWVNGGESPEDENDLIMFPAHAEDLPILYAISFGVMRREVAKSEIDRVEEFHQVEAYRAGVSIRFMREMWGEYYRRLDEAKSVWSKIVPRHRPYVKMARIIP